MTPGSFRDVRAKPRIPTDSRTAPAYNTELPVLKSSAGLEIRSERVYEPENNMVNARPPTPLKSLVCDQFGEGGS